MRFSSRRNLRTAFGDGPRGLMLALKSKTQETDTPCRREAAKISPPCRGLFTALSARKRRTQEIERASRGTWHRRGDEPGDIARPPEHFGHPRGRLSATA